MNARDGRWLTTAGLVLVRQKPGSAKGVMFIAIEGETGPANLVVWPALFEKRRRVVLGSSMKAINGKIQREGDVVHLVARDSSISRENCQNWPTGTLISSCRQAGVTSSPTAGGRIHATGQSLPFSREISLSGISISIPSRLRRGTFIKPQSRQSCRELGGQSKAWLW
jgi:hypothetical protein